MLLFFARPDHAPQKYAKLERRKRGQSKHTAALDLMLPPGPALPAVVESWVEFPNETRREMPDTLRSRLEYQRSNQDEAELSERASQRSERAEHLREAHINSVKERAARDSQRAADAAARKRRRETINAAVLEARSLSNTPALAAAADDPVIVEPLLASRMKRDAEKARRESLAAGVPNGRKARMETELSPPYGVAARKAVLMASAEEERLSSPHPAVASAEPAGGGGVCSTPRPAVDSGYGPFDMEMPPLQAASPERTLDLNVAPLALNSSPQSNKQPHVTPRSAQSPRRQPEMPTIVEEDHDLLFDSPERPARNIYRSFERFHEKIEGPSGATRLG